MLFRLKGSDDLYADVEVLLYDLQRAKNRLAEWKYAPEAERLAEIARLEGLLEQLSH